ncbi:protein of unknown function [Serratia sp. Tan611]|nr:protein of unknown function [Serratia sp. Tan611]
MFLFLSELARIDTIDDTSAYFDKYICDIFNPRRGINKYSECHVVFIQVFLPIVQNFLCY